MSKTLRFASVALVALVAGAAPGQDYTIPWQSIDGGGGRSSVGPFTLSGTIGQPDAFGPTMAGPYTLAGGFWAGVSGDPRCSIADIVVPFGVLDFFDIAAFLQAFSEGGSAADLAPPLGVFNFFDVAAFLQAFSAGCP